MRRGGRAMSKTSSAVKRKWNNANYKRYSFYILKADAEAYEAKCAADGKTLSDIPKQAILDYIKE